MISYEPLWLTMKEKGITTYRLINMYGISSHTIDSLRHNRSITMKTLEEFCRILGCTANDVVRFEFEE